MSQESSISRMQELEIEKEKVYSRMDFWNSQSSWVLFSLLINLLRGWHSYLLCFLHFSLDGRNNAAATTNKTGKQEWQQCCLSWLQWSANIQKKEISFCALFFFVFPFQSEQEKKIKRLCNMIQQEQKTQAKKQGQGFVHFFIHPLWICLASF